MDYTEKQLGDDRIFLLKPRSYMNLSGPAVRDFLSGLPVRKEVLRLLEEGPARDEGPGHEVLRDQGRREVKRDEAVSFRNRLLIVHDDLDLSFGKIRYRFGGSSGGHRGMTSVIQSLGTQAFDRLKVGIGRSEDMDPAEYVLETLGGEEKKAFMELAKHAARTLATWLDEGVGTCASRYNGPGWEFKF